MPSFQFYISTVSIRQDAPSLWSSRCNFPTGPRLSGLLPHRHHRHGSQIHLGHRLKPCHSTKYSHRDNQCGRSSFSLSSLNSTSRPGGANLQWQTCIALIYCIITGILYFDNILPFLACAAMDLLVLVGMIVVAVVMGKPLSYLSCSSLASLGDNDATVYAFSSKLDSVLATINKKIDYASWIGASKTICLETKAIWGLSIALW